MSLGKPIDAHVDGFYVDDNGEIKSTSDPLPSGLHYEFRKKNYGTDVWIVADDGHMDHVFVLWDSLEKLKMVCSNVKKDIKDELNYS
jgi:hypothetical protein